MSGPCILCRLLRRLAIEIRNPQTDLNRINHPPIQHNVHAQPQEARASSMNGSTEALASMGRVEPDKDCFPCCIVWSPIWPLTLFFPFIGHTGIGGE